MSRARQSRVAVSALVLLVGAAAHASPDSGFSRTSVGEATALREPTRDVTSQRAVLTEILSRPEFQRVHGPTWMDRLRQRALQQLTALVRRLFGVSTIPPVGSVLVYVLVFGSFTALALWVYRFALRPSRAAMVAAQPSPPVLKEWRALLSDAHAAAGDGRWREAIHFCYWCAVSFLEQKRGWPPDRSRTPREYLRLLESTDDDRSALALLTRRLELVWYGANAADAHAFGEALASLEKIGCPPV
jgi:hypothetical protein